MAGSRRQSREVLQQRKVQDRGAARAAHRLLDGVDCGVIISPVGNFETAVEAGPRVTHEVMIETDAVGNGEVAVHADTRRPLNRG